MAKQINETQSFGRINYESDFVINILIPDEVGDRDFKLDFYTNVEKVVRFTRRNGVLSSNLKAKEDGSYLAVFRKHGLQAGKLYVKATYTTETDLSPDGEMFDIVPELTRLTLVREAGDMGLNPILELSFPSFNIPNVPDDDEDDNQGGGGSGSIEENTVDLTPKEGDITTKTIRQTSIVFKNPIAYADVENVKMITPKGVVLLGYNGGTYTISEDKLSVVIDWDFEAIEGEYELRIPKGAFMFENGNSNAVINAKYNVSLAPIEYFTPQLEPTVGDVTIDSIKRTTIVFPTPIESFDGSNVRFAKNFGSVWYDYAAKGTISEDNLSMTIDWDFAPEVGLTYTLELPEGCITLKNGDKNIDTKVEYKVVQELFTPSVTPASGDVTSDQLKTVVLTLPSPIKSFDGSGLWIENQSNYGGTSYWYRNSATSTISSDKLALTINWNFTTLTKRTNYTLEIPKGCIELENGHKNELTKVDYKIV